MKLNEIEERGFCRFVFVSHCLPFPSSRTADSSSQRPSRNDQWRIPRDGFKVTRKTIIPLTTPGFSKLNRELSPWEPIQLSQHFKSDFNTTIPRNSSHMALTSKKKDLKGKEKESPERGLGTSFLEMVGLKSRRKHHDSFAMTKVIHSHHTQAL